MFRIIATGIGATVIMDLWGILLKSFGVKGLDMAHLGRWVLTIFQGKWFHVSIANSPTMEGELVTGWITHYLIGVSLCFLLVLVYGSTWLERPTLKPPLVIGLITVILPLLILQPALGGGYFASKSAHPFISILRSFSSHIIYGAGLYGVAKLFQRLTSM